MPSSALAKGQPQVNGRIKFSDFSPDLETVMPGVLLDCSSMVPTRRGMKAYPALVAWSTDALPSACLGTWAGFVGTTFVLVAGTADQLYLLVNESWVTQSLSLTTSTNRWRFSLYGAQLIAVHGVDGPQVYTTGAGVFSALGGSPPTSSLVQATDYSVFLVETDSRTWHSSLTSTNWTPSIASQMVTADLDSTRGNITAAHALREGIALYKANALHFGEFIGPPLYWDFNKVSSETGVLSQEAVANLGDVHYFLGPDDFYSFDGYSLTRIENNLKEWFFDTLDESNADKIATRWDIKGSLIFWHFPSTSASPAGTLDRWICYHLRTGKWSADTAPDEIDIPVFVIIETDQLTYADFKAAYATYGNIPTALTYGDLRSGRAGISGAIKKSDHKAHIYNGPRTGFLTSQDLGDYFNMYQVTRVRPQWAVRPSGGATLVPLSQSNPGGGLTAGDTVTMSSDGWFNLFNTARLQRFKITGNSAFEIVGLECLIEYAGEA